jgi:DNA-binding LacI/PurR family transcriptional regulator
MRYIVNQSRLAGFNKAAQETAFPKDCIQLRTKIRNYRECAVAVQELLSQGVRRFLAMDDDICVDILRTLEATGRVTPGDVEIYSLADSSRLDSYRFPVAALRFDAAELGQIACRELLRCLRNESYDSNPLLGYRIINR